MPSIHVEQTVDLHNCKHNYIRSSCQIDVINFVLLLDSSSSENRFTVRSSTNEAIYGASESSKPRDRLIWGSSRY